MKQTVKIIASLCLIPTLNAFAAEPEIVEEEIVVTVSVDATPEEAYSEIRKQARRACSVRAYQEHTHTRQVAACKSQFVADAVEAFERPGLAALHQERTGEQVTQLADVGNQ